MRVALFFCALAAGCAANALDLPEAPHQVTLSSQWFTPKQGSTMPLAGAQVCVVGHPELPCVMVDDAGAAANSVESGSDVALLLTTPLIYSAVRTARLDSGDLDLGSVLPSQNNYWDRLLDAVGLDFDPQKGNLSLDVGVAGVSLELEPASGTVGYSSASAPSHAPDPSLTTTTEAGVVRLFNADPGIIEVTLRHATLQCNSVYGWRTGPNRFRTLLVAGARTFESIACR